MNKAKYHADPETRKYYIAKARKWNNAYPEKARRAIDKYIAKKKAEAYEKISSNSDSSER